MERNYKIDNLKAILIFFVVLGHLLELFGGVHQKFLYLAIYSFHMPAFVYTTGYFAKRDPWHAFRHFLFPYAVYQTLYFCFRRLVLHKQIVLQYTTPYWLLWYLLACFFWLLLLPAFDSVRKENRLAVVGTALLVALLVGLDPTVGYAFSLSRTVVFFPSFLMGYYRLPEQISERLGPRITTLVSGMVAAGGLGFIAFQTNLLPEEAFYQTNSYFDQHARFLYPNLLERLFSMLMGIAWIFLLQNIVTAKKVPVLSQVGRYTMPVFLLHGFGILWLRAHNIFLWREEVCILVAVVLAAAICLLLGNPVVYRALRFTFAFPKRNQNR